MSMLIYFHLLYGMCFNDCGFLAKILRIKFLFFLSTGTFVIFSYVFDSLLT